MRPRSSRGTKPRFLSSRLPLPIELVLEPLPTGTTNKSGSSHPKNCAARNTVAWCPSMRAGWRLLIGNARFCSTSSRTIRMHSSKLPGTRITLAPCISGCISCTGETSSRGNTTTHEIPAGAAYAAAMAEVSPVEAQINALTPDCLETLT